MTTPTVFSNVAGNPFVAKEEPQGVIAQSFSVALTAGEAIGTNYGLLRFQRGFSLISLAVLASDMDTATTLTLNFGYLYDGTTGESASAFLSASTIGQTGTSVIWPIAAGLLTGVSFTATGPGYLSMTSAGEIIEVSGTVQGIATFTYNLAS